MFLLALKRAGQVNGGRCWGLVPPALVGDGMEYEEGGDAFCRAGREALQKLPPLTLNRPLVTSRDGLMGLGRP